MRARDLLRAALVAIAFVAPMEARAQAPSASAQELPPGHPSVDPGGGDDEAADPHQQVPGGVPGMFKPPPDKTVEDASLPPNSITVELRDPDDKPIANEPVTLGSMQQSVAKGDSRSRKAQTTDERGQTTFTQLATGSGVSYRVSCVKDGATFAARPFPLAPNRAVRVTLHVYPVSRDVKQALVVFQGAIGVEVRDDRLQFEQLFEVGIFGRYAWIPNDLLIELPEGFTALNAQQSMSDQGIDPIDKKGARLKGTFGPGRHEIVFRWQLPWSGDKDVLADIGMPPHVASMRVIAMAGQGVRLSVDGFPAPTSDRDEQGQTRLVTEYHAGPNDAPLSRLRLSLLDLPTQGPARWIATACAALAVAFGLVFATQSKKSGAGALRGDSKGVRAALLADLEELERAHRAGDVGPKTYERARREIIDAIARTLAPEQKSAS
jgi:hypothetical protein